MSTSKVIQSDNEDYCCLPFGFRDLEIFFTEPDNWSYYAKWEDRPVWSRHPKGPWYFKTEGNPEVTKED